MGINKGLFWELGIKHDEENMDDFRNLCESSTRY